jgi:hypothetical protein
LPRTLQPAVKYVGEAARIQVVYGTRTQARRHAQDMCAPSAMLSCRRRTSRVGSCALDSIVQTMCSHVTGRMETFALGRWGSAAKRLVAHQLCLCSGVESGSVSMVSTRWIDFTLPRSTGRPATRTCWIETFWAARFWLDRGNAIAARILHLNCDMWDSSNNQRLCRASASYVPMQKGS